MGSLVGKSMDESMAKNQEAMKKNQQIMVQTLGIFIEFYSLRLVFIPKHNCRSPIVVGR